MQVNNECCALQLYYKDGKKLYLEGSSIHILHQTVTVQGAWRGVGPAQLQVRQISGGLSNLVFYIGLPPGVAVEGGEPGCVLLRLFGDLSHGAAAQHRVVTETLVFTLLAERGLGPRLAGVFPGGRLEEFIKVSESADFL